MRTIKKLLKLITFGVILVILSAGYRIFFSEKAEKLSHGANDPLFKEADADAPAPSCTSGTA